MSYVITMRVFVKYIREVLGMFFGINKFSLLPENTKCTKERCNVMYTFFPCLKQSPEWVCIYRYRERRGRSLKLTTHILRVPRLRRTEGDIPPRHLYSYMVREWKTSPFLPTHVVDSCTPEPVLYCVLTCGTQSKTAST
jgi:hypothetical protein